MNDENSNKSENAHSKIYSFSEYKTDFENDIVCAEKSVSLFLPYLTKVQVQNFIHLFSKIISNGARIIVFTKNALTKETQKKQDTLILQLENAGSRVVKRNELFQKTAIIDEKILWYGSINFLSAENFYTCSTEENDACTIRIFNATVAQEIETEMVGKENL